MMDASGYRELSPGAAAVEFTDGWYEEAGSAHFWVRWRFDAWLRLVRRLGLPLGEPWTALDVGGGIGVSRSQIEGVTAWTVDLAELHRAALERALPGRGRNLLYDLRDRAPDLVGRYDAVLLLDVLEHVGEPGPFLAAAADHLRPGGWIVLNLPALPRLFGAYDRAQGHHRRYDRPTLGREADAAGLVVRAARYWGLSLVPLAAVRSLWLGRLERRGSPAAEIHLRGFRPPGRLAVAMLDAARAVETRLPFPFLGSSLVAALQPAPGRPSPASPTAPSRESGGPITRSTT